MTKHGFLFALWLAATVALLLVSSACGGSQSQVKSATVTEVEEPVWCVVGEMVNGVNGMFCSNREKACNDVRTQAGERGVPMGLVGISDCSPVFVTLKSR